MSQGGGPQDWGSLSILNVVPGTFPAAISEANQINGSRKAGHLLAVQTPGASLTDGLAAIAGPAGLNTGTVLSAVKQVHWPERRTRAKAGAVANRVGAVQASRLRDRRLRPLPFVSEVTAPHTVQGKVAKLARAV